MKVEQVDSYFSQRYMEIQTASSRIWTPSAVSISNDDNRYTMSASIL